MLPGNNKYCGYFGPVDRIKVQPLIFVPAILVFYWFRKNVTIILHAVFFGVIVVNDVTNKTHQLHVLK